MKRQAYAFKVLSRGRELQEHEDDDGTNWVAATRGDRFELYIANDSDWRVMAVCSVDGLCVMTGEPAEDARLRGYIIQPGARMVVPGWRLDDDHVAEFEFTAAAKSYSAQMGRKNDKHGYLICDIYRERPLPPPPKPPVEIAEVDEDFAFAPSERDNILRSAPADKLFSRSAGETESTFDTLLNDAAEADEPDNLGVGFGKKAEHRTTTVDFSVDHSAPPVRLAIRYDTERGLQRRGMGCAVPPKWSPQTSGQQPGESPGDLARFMRDVEKRRENKRSEGWGARLKRLFGG